jgi:hypothetical protein
MIAVALGWVVLQERLTGTMLFGALLVVGSVIAVWLLEPSSIPKLKESQDRHSLGLRVTVIKASRLAFPTKSGMALSSVSRMNRSQKNRTSPSAVGGKFG